MAKKKLSGHESADKQKAVVGPIDRNRKRKFGTYSYKKEYARLVFDLLAKSNAAKTKSHCCNALQCSRPTFNRWLEQFPEFKEAFETGLEIGKAKWRDRLSRHAFRPTTEVNNGLIKMLSANVYGIKEDAQQIALTAPESIKFVVEVVDASKNNPNRDT